MADDILLTLGRIDLEAAAGPDWAGFYLTPFGRAKSLRLETPDGYTLQARELINIDQDRLDLGYVKARLVDMEAKVGGATATFTRDESRLLRVALEILMREIPISLGTRDFNVRSDMLVRQAKSA